MAIDNPQTSWAEKLQSLPKPVIYGVLLLCSTIPLFFSVKLPNKPIEASIDFYGQTMKLPDNGKVIICSDWTNSTRGESKGEMEALLRILMRKHIKFVLLSIGDVQAPQVAKDTIREVSDQEVKDGGKPYKEFEDFVVLGYYAAAEGTILAANNNFLSIAKSKKDFPEGSGPRDALQSPVFQGIKTIADFDMFYLITASNTSRIIIERITKCPMMFMVTGVMVPENNNYYTSKQLKGLCGGVKGVYDLETLMDNGINNPGPAMIESDLYKERIPGWPGKKNDGKGTAYYLALHFTLTLLILAVVVGNVGMFLSKRGAK
jgi:hypothetical protein